MVKLFALFTAAVRLDHTRLLTSQTRNQHYYRLCGRLMKTINSFQLKCEQNDQPIVGFWILHRYLALIYQSPTYIHSPDFELSEIDLNIVWGILP